MLQSGLRKFYLSIFLFFSFFILLIPSSYCEPIDGIAAIVNNGAITNSEVEIALKQKGFASNRREAIEKMIDNTLLKQAIEQSKIGVEDDELQREILAYMRGKRMSLEQLQAELRSQGMTYEEFKENIKDQLKHVKFVRERIAPEVKISERDLLDFYAQNPDRFQKVYKARIARILLPTPTTNEEAAILQQKTAEILKQLGEGKSFETLASKYSNGPEAKDGGNLGEIEVNKLSPPLPEVVKSLEPGKFSPPVMTKEGIVIIKLLGLSKLTADAFDKIRDQIYDELFDSKINEELISFLQEQRRSSYIEIR